MSYLIQQIFKDNLDNFIKKYHPCSRYIYHFNNIISCKTKQLGISLVECDSCHNTSFTFHSCKNRHCPCCQNGDIDEWINKESKNIFKANYFHTVFTLPSELNDLIFHNKKVCYEILFKAASDTILEFCKSKVEGKTYLGATPGILAILHSWGSNMSFHPHLHCLISGIGVDDNGKVIKSTNDKFLFPVEAASIVFRAKFIDGLNKAKLDTSFDPSFYLIDVLKDVSKKNWIVYTRDCLTSVDAVVNYFARYSNRVCISNSRIKSYDANNNLVTISYKDYHCEGSIKKINLSGFEFMRRFALHFLPKGFRKIRHYGYLANKSSLLNILKKSLDLIAKSKPIQKLLCCNKCGNVKVKVRWIKTRFASFTAYINNLKLDKKPDLSNFFYLRC